MLDEVLVFSYSGIVIYSRRFLEEEDEGFGERVERGRMRVNVNPIDEVIKLVLLEGKGSSGKYDTEKHRHQTQLTQTLSSVRWLLEPNASLTTGRAGALASSSGPSTGGIFCTGIVFATVNHKSLYVPYVEDLLTRLKIRFLAHCSSIDDCNSFDKVLGEILMASEMDGKKERCRLPPSNCLYNNSSQEKLQRNIGIDSNLQVENGTHSHLDEEDSSHFSGLYTSDSELSDGEILENRSKLGMRAIAGRTKAGRRSVGKSNRASAPVQTKTTKKGTVWHDGSSRRKITKKDMESLDKSKEGRQCGSGGSEPLCDEMPEEIMAAFLPSKGELPQWEEEEDEDMGESNQLFEGIENEKTRENSSTMGSFFSSWNMGGLLDALTGNRVMSQGTLDPVLDKIKRLLISKNVAIEVAQEVCDSVQSSLVNHRINMFDSVQHAVKEALKEVIERILLPGGETDVLQNVMEAKRSGKQYSIVFVGVNGVGKSTSLAKVAYFLKHNGVSVMIAACDTFRSGAVEQLTAHAKCLGVPLFQRGYAKDPSAVARDAMKEAASHGIDCVLIDTAGRMQNNEPLMRALSSLVVDNRPSFVLFVGEALVGNDGVNQLLMFSDAITKHSPPGMTRGLNGIMLTKFDTVDLKVGAALSMAYKSGLPIVFVGTGQKFTHLRRLNVNSIIRSLFE